MSDRVAIISVTHNSAGVIGSMLESVPPGAIKIVVDNHSNDNSIEIATELGAEVVELEQNLGFGKACNLGAAKAPVDYLLFLNPDTVLARDAINILLQCMDNYPGSAAANPKIIKSNGKPDFKRRSVLLPRSKWHSRGWPDNTCEVNVLLGAAMFIRRDAFESVGGFDENIFLYHEDDDLSLRLKEHYGSLLFIKDATVTHLQGRSSERSDSVAGWKSYHQARSRVYTLLKHHRPLPRMSTICVALAKFLSPAFLVSRRKRSQATGFFRGVASMLRT